MNTPPFARSIAAVAFSFLAAVSTALAGFSGTDVFVPSLGRGPGASSSQWNACIWVHNPNASPVNVTFRLLLRDQPNPSPQVFHDTIPAGDTRRYDDALATLFGVTVKTFGAVRITTPAGQGVIVNARSYSTPAGGGQEDTTGQFYAALPASFAIGPGQGTELLGVYQTTPQDSSEFRYNYGFVETTGTPVTVRVTALDPTGAQVGSPKSYALGGFEARQYNITDLLPSVNATNLRLEVAVTSGPGQVVAFGSGIANRSNDPSTFEMSFRDELLAANTSGGGLTAVSHDGTLKGDGTGAAPLGIADGGVGNRHIGANAVTTETIADGGVATVDLANGAVTKTKLAASGGTNGQVLGTDGSNLTWSNAAGFTLPFRGSQADGNTLLWVSNTGAGIGVEGDSTGKYGVYGSTSAPGYPGTYGISGSSTNGVGVEGDAYYGTTGVGVLGVGSSIGVKGTSGSIGVRGESNTDGIGVYGFTANGMEGVYGESDRTNGYGVYGVAANGTMNAGVYGAGAGGTGVWGAATSGFGVYGISDSWTGVNGVGVNGVTGLATSSAGRGVGGYGYGSGIGVYGESASGYAVAGVSSAQYGVKGDGGNIGVYAHNSTVNGHDVYLATQALAIDAYGDVNVRGNLVKSSGSFRIDHPLDPANRYLAHSFVESPDMMNVYNGNVVTDADGVAVVELPAYFEALNRDFRYQLTVIGRFAQAIIEKEIEGNRFTIRTNLADVKVSWQVTGIRKDPWADAHRIVVEESKAEGDRGNYVHPELYGEPAERSVGRTDHVAPSKLD